MPPPGPPGAAASDEDLSPDYIRTLTNEIQEQRKQRVIDFIHF